MKISVKKLNMYLFFIAYFIFLAFSLLAQVEFLGMKLKLLTNLSLGLLTLSIIMQLKKYTRKEIMLFIIMIAVSLLIFNRTEDASILKLSLLLIAMKNMEFEKCVKFDFYIRLLLMSSLLLLFYLGYAQDVTSYYNGQIRHSLGFTNPNSLGMHTLILCLDSLYLKQFKVSNIQILCILLLLLFADYFAGSRTTTLVLILALLLSFIYKYKQTFFDSKIVKFIIQNSFLFFAVITFVLYRLYLSQNFIGVELNQLLSNRLYNINVYSTVFNIGLFGNNLTNAPNTMDNAFAYILYGLGIIMLIVFIIAFKKLFKILYQERKILLIIIMFCFSIYGLSERLWLSVDYNIFMLVFSNVLYNKQNKERQLE